VRQGDGYEGWQEYAPFDRIIVTAAASEVPKALIEQLAIGGRLVAPVGPTWIQELIVVDKKPDGTVKRSTGPLVMFLPMRHVHN
jgi:protein-L-isoaspartate(D-aspartate) O-methyltransferase